MRYVDRVWFPGLVPVSACGKVMNYFQLLIHAGDHSAATEGSDQFAQTNAGQPTSSVTAKGEL